MAAAGAGHHTVEGAVDVDLRDRVERVLTCGGPTFARASGIEPADDPAPLWQLLVLTMLLAHRIRAEAAVTTAHEFFRAGWTTPETARAAGRSAVVAACGRGGFRRYDFSTADRLPRLAAHALTRWGGDLRRLRAEADGSADEVARLVQEFPGIGPAGARIFVREVQAVWPEIGPVFDDLALAGARLVGLPERPERLADLAGAGRVADLAAALTRIGRKPSLWTGAH